VPARHITDYNLLKSYSDQTFRPVRPCNLICKGDKDESDQYWNFDTVGAPSKRNRPIPSYLRSDWTMINIEKSKRFSYLLVPPVLDSFRYLKPQLEAIYLNNSPYDIRQKENLATSSTRFPDTDANFKSRRRSLDP